MFAHGLGQDAGSTDYSLNFDWGPLISGDITGASGASTPVPASTAVLNPGQDMAPSVIYNPAAPGNVNTAPPPVDSSNSFSNLVGAIATGAANYYAATTAAKVQAAKVQAANQPLTTQYNPAYSGVYPGYGIPAAVSPVPSALTTAQNNTMLYTSLGIGALLLVLALR